MPTIKLIINLITDLASLQQSKRIKFPNQIRIREMVQGAIAILDRSIQKYPKKTSRM